MKVSFISLGCAKNTVNAEQMMALCRDAGMELLAAPEGADVVVINTCGFIDSAKSEAIDNIIAMGELKAEGRIGKILVTGCLSQRYKEEILTELPEVDGVLGTGSYSEIVSAIEEVTLGGVPCRFGSIHAPVEELDRVLTTPPYIAYLRIAEGCDNHCAYCVIPSLRGKYRSRQLENVLAEAQKLADGGVKELIIIAQDITRYGIDLYGEKKLSALLRALCKMDFRWIRLHYLYPDEIDDELIDTIAEEPKILKYLDIPIQHCNDEVLRAMNRRNTKEELLELFYTLRGRIEGLVLRTSLITGLPFEDEAAFDELCRFLREVEIERAGVFPYSPEEGTRAALMENRVDTAEAERRAELVVDVQSRIMDDFNESRMGDITEVLCEGWDGQAMSYAGRSWAESPDIDGRIYFTAQREVKDGEFVPVRITGTMDGELTGELWEE
ncbi:MAG: 30S ribosomal protein S12 methylthiotransferase RimO [Oscillospiraceae bacterium]|nr:30S ribosomal protein S12 methylthiotransferase RimO [Oscillospiraceae bacterium]